MEKVNYLKLKHKMLALKIQLKVYKNTLLKKTDKKVF